MRNTTCCRFVSFICVFCFVSSCQLISICCLFVFCSFAFFLFLLFVRFFVFIWGFFVAFFCFPPHAHHCQSYWESICYWLSKRCLKTLDWWEVHFFLCVFCSNNSFLRASSHNGGGCICATYGPLTDLNDLCMFPFFYPWWSFCYHLTWSSTLTLQKIESPNDVVGRVMAICLAAKTAPVSLLFT